MISAAEKKRRREYFEYAVASFAPEGATTDSRLVKKAEEYINGKMTIDDLIEWYDKLCEKDNAEKKHRKKCFNAAVASFALEGIYPDPRLLDKVEDYFNGKMTIKELIQWYHNLCAKNK